MAQSPPESHPAIVSEVWVDGERVGALDCAAVEQRARGIRLSSHPRLTDAGPCALLLWTSTVGPPFG